MRHRRRGRHLGRSSPHRRAMLRNLASSLFLTERDESYYDDLTGGDGRVVNPPASRGRVVTTLQKAKEVRRLVEKCITIARHSLKHTAAAGEHETDAERGDEAWKQWRHSDEWQKWNHAIAPALAARRRALKLLGDKEAVRILFEDIAPRFESRDGGYTRVVRLATPRLGDAGVRAILELVGVHDRVAEQAERPAFTDDSEESTDDSGGAGDEDLTAEESEEITTEESHDAEAGDSAAEATSEEGSPKNDAT